MSNKRKTEMSERQALLSQVKTEQKKAGRKRTVIIASVTSVLVVALIGTTIAVLADQRAKDASVQALASKPIAGVEKFTGLARDHVAGKVNYAQTPPTGGDHSVDLQNCGFYPEPVGAENAVHSLEHGAVWITRDPNLPAAQLDTLRALAKKNNYLLVSPREGLSSPVVASAWGIQLKLDSADDARLPVFLRAYLNGPQTPEPGASCAGGVGTPE